MIKALVGRKSKNSIKVYIGPKIQKYNKNLNKPENIKIRIKAFIGPKTQK
jgi:hypothetical protein